MREENGVAIAGFVLAMVSVILFWVPFVGTVLLVVAVVLSGVGLHRTSQRQRPHKGLAIAGLAVGIPLLVVSAFITTVTTAAIIGGTTAVVAVATLEQETLDEPSSRADQTYDHCVAAGGRLKVQVGTYVSPNGTYVSSNDRNSGLPDTTMWGDPLEYVCDFGNN